MKETEMLKKNYQFRTVLTKGHFFIGNFAGNVRQTAVSTSKRLSPGGKLWYTTSDDKYLPHGGGKEEQDNADPCAGSRRKFSEICGL